MRQGRRRSMPRRKRRSNDNREMITRSIVWREMGRTVGLKRLRSDLFSRQICVLSRNINKLLVPTVKYSSSWHCSTSATGKSSEPEELALIAQPFRHLFHILSTTPLCLDLLLVSRLAGRAVMFAPSRSVTVAL